MLHPGLYEQIINNALTSELSEIPATRKAVAPSGKGEEKPVKCGSFEKNLLVSVEEV